MIYYFTNPFAGLTISLPCGTSLEMTPDLRFNAYRKKLSLRIIISGTFSKSSHPVLLCSGE